MIRATRLVREGMQWAQQNGLRLGDIGSWVVAEVFVGMLDGDALSFLNQTPDFEPGLFKSEASRVAAGTYTMVDLMTFVDDINPIG